MMYEGVAFLWSKEARTSTNPWGGQNRAICGLQAY